MEQSGEIERLRQENEALRDEVAKLTKQKKSSKLLGCAIGAGLLMIVVFLVIPVIAAIALPMYSTFKARHRATMALTALSNITEDCKAWHAKGNSFEGASIASEGGRLMQGSESMGVALPQIEGMKWSAAGDEDSLMIQFTWGEDGSRMMSDGQWLMQCDEDGCIVSAEVGGEEDPLGMNF